MKKTEIFCIAAIFCIHVFFTQNLSAQSFESNPPVEIKNTSDEKRKICLHKQKMISLFAIGCVELYSGESINWDREGVFTPFTVKVYQSRKLIDKYLYSRDLPADTAMIKVSSGNRFGFSRFKNISTKYELRVCNTRYPDKVYFVLGFETNSGFWTEGWWSVEKGDCINIPVSKRLKEKFNIPYGTLPRTYYYARTYAGGESLYWRGGDGDSELCINTKKAFSKLQFRQDGTGVKTPLPCEADNESLIKFRTLKDPTVKQKTYYLTF